MRPALCGPRHIPRETTGYENQPEAVFWQLQAKEIEDIIGICNYMGPISASGPWSPATTPSSTRTALGIDISEDEFMRLGQQAYNLEKAFNTIHAGFAPKDDYPPAQIRGRTRRPRSLCRLQVRQRQVGRDARPLLRVERVGRGPACRLAPVCTSWAWTTWPTGWRPPGS